MKCYTLQGHPYSNDEPAPGEEMPGAPSWFYWLVIGAIGVIGGLWLRKATEENKKRDQ